MTETIRFPHLGISLDHVGRSVSLWGFHIAFYGMVIALAMFAGIYLVLWTARKTGQDPDEYFNFAILAIVLSVLGARIYYVVFSWDYYGSHPEQILDFRGGGLAIYGGILTGITCAVVHCIRKRRNMTQFLDTACLGLITGQAIGRWGNFFNREAFGGYTDNLFAMQLPVDAVHPSEITGEMAEHMITIGGTDFIQVHPTFLYESLWNFGLLLFLLILTFRWKRRTGGEIFLLYLLCYGLGRFWIEPLRTDQLLLTGTGIPVSQLLSGILAVGAGLLLILRFRAGRGR